MPRSVNHVASKARRKKVLKMAKGYFGRRKNVWTVAKNAVEKGLGYAYRDRKQKKRNVRSVWIVRINAAVREFDMSYSEFIGKLNAKNITLSRKALADLALNHPEAFKAIVNEVKDATPVSRPDNAPRVKNTTVAATETKKATTAKSTVPKPKAETTTLGEISAKTEANKVEAKIESSTETATATKAAPKAKAEKKGDDLKVLNGVGPAFEKRLNALGIYTFADLIALTDEKIAELETQDSMTSLEEWHSWIEEAKTLA